jgi:hypothetical protein
MWQIVKAELAYSRSRLAVWSALVLFFALYPELFELAGLRPGVADTTAARLARSGLAPFLGFIVIFQLLLVNELLELERREKRLRLLTMLPLTSKAVALARLARILAIPAITLLLGGLLWLVLPAPGSSLWAVSGISVWAAVLLQVLALLHDLGGGKYKLVAALVLGGASASLFFTFPEVISTGLAAFGAMLAAPLGTMLGLVLVAGLVLVGLELFNQRLAA